MNALAKLEQRVRNDGIQIVHINAVPRSFSTVLGRSLAETKTGIYVHEPFNISNRNINYAAAAILAAADDSCAKMVITKSIARNLSADTFLQWTELCHATVWSVRDPLVQMGSLLTRMANDLHIGKGSDVLSQDDIYSDLRIVEASLQQQNFAATGWQAMSDHFALVKSSQQHIIDGHKLVEKPSFVLENLCRRLGMAYRQDLANDWKRDHINANKTYIDKFDEAGNSMSAWVNRAFSSTGFEPNNRREIGLSLLPETVATHITSVAIPTFKMMTEGAQ